MPVSKISISLPPEALKRADRARRATGETRSELVRRALDALFEAERRRAAVERYVAGYVAEPETAYEVAQAETLATSAFDTEEWD